MRTESRRTLSLAVGGIIAASALGAFLATQGQADDPQSAIVRAEAARSGGDAVAARVNDTEIREGTVAAVTELLRAFPVEGVSANNRSGVIDFLVNNELLQQEALRRGVAAKDDDVTAAIVEAQKAFQADLATGAAPPQIVNIIEGLAKAGHPLASWHTDPLIRDQYRRTLNGAALFRDETKAVADAAGAGRAEADRRMAQLTSRLRSSALVEVPAK